MSISSAPSSTAERTSASLTSIGYWPEGKPVATDATLTPLPSSFSCAYGDEVGVDADGRDRRDRPVDRIRAHRLRAERRDLAGRVRALERRQVHHPDREVEREHLRVRLIERFASDAARSSTATWSTEPMRGRRGSSGSSKPRGRAGAWAMRSSVASTSGATVIVPGAMRGNRRVTRPRRCLRPCQLPVRRRRSCAPRRRV